MELPWETIFGAAGGSAIVTVLGVLVAQKVIEGIVDAGARRVDSALTQAEETHKQQLELASRKVESALAQAEETHKKQLELAGGG